ncbi:MAG: hypothetical protein P8177_05095 [Gemmatimonadota bacterium]
MTTAGARGRCIFCHASLATNDVIEHFPVGKRIAFDPGRGRLWAVCMACHRWNLAPFDDRWEALEELEKAHVDRGRVLASTEHIALVNVPGVELVRVGGARLAEEAWWRYGNRMMRRRRQARVLTWAELALIAGAAVASGGIMYLGGGGVLNNLVRWRRFGSIAWRGNVDCIRCGAPLTELTFRSARKLHLSRDGEQDPALHLRCRRCRLRREDGEFQIEGAPAQHLLRRVITYSHYSGASEKRVRSATDYIEKLGHPAAVTRDLTSTGLRIDALLDRGRRTQAVALEIALNEEHERRLLEMELAELEARWREEEKIAAIVDGPLTSVDGLDRLQPVPPVRPIED